MKTIITIIPTNLVRNLLLSSFSAFLETKNKNLISISWWSGKKKYFCFLLIASRALLQSQSNSIDFYKGIFLHVIPVRIIVP